MKKVDQMNVQDLINNRITCMYCGYHGKNTGGNICLANGNCPFEKMSLEEVRRVCKITVRKK